MATKRGSKSRGQAWRPDPRFARFVREVFENIARSSTERSIQLDVGVRGLLDDQGGHLVAYRFLPEQGSTNLFPQSANFNVSAYKTLENDYARYIKSGYQVDFVHTLGNFDQLTARPGTVKVDFTVRNKAGNVLDSFRHEFDNTAGQTYVRRKY